MKNIIVQKIGYPSKKSKLWIAQCPYCSFFNNRKTKQDALEDMAAHIGLSHEESKLGL